MSYRNKPVLERFNAKVRMMDGGCHEWQSTLHRDGYGKFWLDGKQVQAHRASYLLHHGEIPNGQWVLHKCDNRKCVNPDHLYIGDRFRNAQDKVERCPWWGRMKYSFNDITEMRRKYATGKYSQQELAKMYGCDQTQVSKYVRMKQRISK